MVWAVVRAISPHSHISPGTTFTRASAAKGGTCSRIGTHAAWRHLQLPYAPPTSLPHPRCRTRRLGASASPPSRAARVGPGTYRRPHERPHGATSRRSRAVDRIAATDRRKRLGDRQRVRGDDGPADEAHRAPWTPAHDALCSMGPPTLAQHTD